MDEFGSDLAASVLPLLLVRDETDQVLLEVRYSIVNVSDTTREENFSFRIALEDVTSSGQPIFFSAATVFSPLQPGEGRDEEVLVRRSAEVLDFSSRLQLELEVFDNQIDQDGLANNVAGFGPVALADLDIGIRDNLGPTPGRLSGTDANETFLFFNDESRDLVIGFDPANDLLDVSELEASSLDDLRLTNLLGGDGSIRWVQVTDREGDAEFIVRFADSGATDKAALTADKFVFTAGTPRPIDPEPLIQVLDNFFRDTFQGTEDAERFVLARDGDRDVIRDFNVVEDVLDVTALGAASLDDLALTELVNGSGEVRWVAIAGPEDVDEVIVRFLNDTPTSAAALTADRFVFADEPLVLPEPVSTIVNDTSGLDNLRGQSGPEIFAFGDDGQRDTLRDFDLGTDQIDVSAFGATGLGNLQIENLIGGNGSVRWVQISDSAGDAELIVRFNSDQVLSADVLDDADFIFAMA
ncbi:MAG: hypothetical protein AAF557_19140 [Pseudomonadota bacterium]